MFFISMHNRANRRPIRCPNIAVAVISFTPQPPSKSILKSTAQPQRPHVRFDGMLMARPSCGCLPNTLAAHLKRSRPIAPCRPSSLGYFGTVPDRRRPVVKCGMMRQLSPDLNLCARHFAVPVNSPSSRASSSFVQHDKAMHLTARQHFNPRAIEALNLFHMALDRVHYLGCRASS